LTLILTFSLREKELTANTVPSLIPLPEGEGRVRVRRVGVAVISAIENQLA